MTYHHYPKPTAEVLSHSKQLTALIQQDIERHNGFISFAQYMQLALYHPLLGYYSAKKNIIGKKGDFITAPTISPLFAQCLAKQCQQIFQHLSNPALLEIGAGTGQLAFDLLTALVQLNALPNHYFILEQSAHLRQQQYALLQTLPTALFSRIQWVEDIPVMSGVVLANEVLDALPVHCFAVTEQGIHEKGVGYIKGQLSWQLRSIQDDYFRQAVSAFTNHYHLPIGYQSEINLQLATFIQPILQQLQEGVVLFLDYGYGQAEYYHPERMRGTLTCFYEQHQQDNPFLLPGMQDITTHVDFTRVIEIAADAGATLGGYTTQAAFLLACGLMELAAHQEATLSASDKVGFQQAIKLLTFPTEMGERVKVMALNKNYNYPLQGFMFSDRSREL